ILSASFSHEKRSGRKGQIKSISRFIFNVLLGGYIAGLKLVDGFNHLIDFVHVKMQVTRHHAFVLIDAPTASFTVGGNFDVQSALVSAVRTAERRVSRI